MSAPWPVVLTSTEITLRPLRFRDRKQWHCVRAQNREWLTPWEATIPVLPEKFGGPELSSELPSFYEMVRTYNREGRHERSFSFAIFHGKTLIGQISLGGVIYGAMRAGHIGYWIDRHYANKGYTTQAVNMLTNYAFVELALHRVEINLRPENMASRRVAEKAGYVLEGERPRYLHIDGGWRDHISFVKENPALK
jgi:ribosomal-protein-alanine N-acetyltransferase